MRYMTAGLSEGKTKVISKAIVPAAGRGSRMLPLTSVIPKEMLPVGGKPLIQLAVEEAVESGLSEIAIVIREGKEVIRDFFRLRSRDTLNGDWAINGLETLVARCEITFIYQQQQRGLGDALLQARDFVGSDSFVMMIPDQLARTDRPATAQMLQNWTPGAAVWSSLVRLPKEETPFFPGARGFEFERISGSDQLRLGSLLSEQEMRELYRECDYEIRGFGRTIYPPQIFDYLGPDYANSAGEVDLARTFAELTKTVANRGVLLSGEFFDFGTLPGYYRYRERF